MAKVIIIIESTLQLVEGFNDLKVDEMTSELPGNYFNMDKSYSVDDNFIV